MLQRPCTHCPTLHHYLLSGVCTHTRTHARTHACVQNSVSNPLTVLAIPHTHNGVQESLGAVLLRALTLAANEAHARQFAGQEDSQAPNPAIRQVSLRILCPAACNACVALRTHAQRTVLHASQRS